MEDMEDMAVQPPVVSIQSRQYYYIQVHTREGTYLEPPPPFPSIHPRATVHFLAFVSRFAIVVGMPKKGNSPIRPRLSI